MILEMYIHICNKLLKIFLGVMVTRVSCDGRTIFRVLRDVDQVFCDGELISHPLMGVGYSLSWLSCDV